MATGGGGLTADRRSAASLTFGLFCMVILDVTGDVCCAPTLANAFNVTVPLRPIGERLGLDGRHTQLLGRVV
jgi:hypothetical protein